MGKPDIQLSAAEKRLLRKVFHRHALPYLAAMAVVTAVAVFGGEPKEAEVSAEAAVPPPELAALVQARIDADALVAELTATAAQQNAAAESAASELESLEKGIDTASRRLRDLESKARKAQKKLDEVASAPPPEAAGRLRVAAVLLGIDVELLREALGPPPADIPAASRKLGIGQEVLREALGIPPTKPDTAGLPGRMPRPGGRADLATAAAQFWA